MKIYNTLSRTKEEFVPVQEGKVSMYVCGPTVYNLIHIGNARPMIIFDTVRRYMEYKGYDVNYVSNFTDVDDKIIAKAIAEGVSASEISEKYIAECKKDMEGMNVKPATTHPLATQEIDGMIKMIRTLIDKGYAYVVEDGTVYYRTRKFTEYGKLSKKNIDDLEAGKRIAVEEQKEDALDFVLWKPKKEGEPYWESPWCQGRPGWHIECSVMAKKYLGDEIDIHAGGEDLIFPHHENEIAQSEAANGKPFAKYWMHNGFLNIDNRKMSKSLGNFFTVRDISEKYDLQVLRFFMLSAHYRSPLNFSADLMEASRHGLERIVTAAERLRELTASAAEGQITEQERTLLEEAEGFVKKFEAAMEDDFNTADGVAAIFELVKFINSNGKAEQTKAFLAELEKRLALMCDIMGIITEKKERGLDKEIEALIAERQAARKEKNFARADEIRDQLLAQGIVLEDTREGVKWKSMRTGSVEELEKLAETFREKLDTKELDLRTYSPLTLAFVGDGIYDLLIRTMVVKEANTSNHALHKKTTGFVRAEAQAMMARALQPILSEEEEQVYRRGRNAKMATMAKHASMSDYKQATGFEALLGYLYLKGDYERLLQVTAAGLNAFLTSGGEGAK